MGRHVPIKWGAAMSENSATDKPYKCPGCDTELPAEPIPALKHMAQCIELQGMIAFGRAVHAARCKRQEALRGADAHDCSIARRNRRATPQPK
jgi:hypothetical protein